MFKQTSLLCTDDMLFVQTGMSRHFRIGFGRYQGLRTEKFFSVFRGKTSFTFEGVKYFRSEIHSYLCWCSKNRGKFKQDHQIHRLVSLWHEIIDQESDDDVRDAREHLFSPAGGPVETYASGAQTDVAESGVWCVVWRVSARGESRAVDEDVDSWTRDR